MKLGVVSVALDRLPFDEGLALLERLGITAIEIGCGGFDTKRAYGDPDELLRDESVRRRWLEAFARHGLEISALAIHGTPLSPESDVRTEYSRQLQQACRLAETIGVDRLTLLAGLPEGGPGDQTPCWIITAPLPNENRDVLRWQWDERVLPYWSHHVEIANNHGCRLCFEMHPGDVVYNPASLRKLREALGPTIGCNYDPSHLFWQNIDAIEAVHEIGDMIYHVHAKDTSFTSRLARVNGVLDPTSHEEPAARSWNYRTVGYGHDQLFWKELLSALAMVGYRDVISIEHEDRYASPEDALGAASRFLRDALPPDGNSSAYEHADASRSYGYQAWDRDQV